MTCLIYCSTSRTITGEARDAIIELIMRNCEYRALNWAERLVDINGNDNSTQYASKESSIPCSLLLSCELFIFLIL